MSKAKSALPCALAALLLTAAGEKHSGGKALGASFEDSHGKPAFHVRTTHKSGIWEGMVDATSA